MSEQEAGSKLLVFLPTAGILAGFLMSVLVGITDYPPLFSGFIFGLLLACGLYLAGILRSPQRAFVLVVVATAAYFLSFFAAFGLQMKFPQIVPIDQRWSMSTSEPAAPMALLAGGLVGGFLLFGSVVLLLSPRKGIAAAARRVVLGTVLGGLLGIAGWALRSSLGIAIWHLFAAFRLTPFGGSPREWFGGQYDYSETTRMYSLFFVWQTGVATAIAVMLRRDLQKSKQNG